MVDHSSVDPQNAPESGLFRLPRTSSGLRVANVHHDITLQF